MIILTKTPVCLIFSKYIQNIMLHDTMQISHFVRKRFAMSVHVIVRCIKAIFLFLLRFLNFTFILILLRSESVAHHRRKGAAATAAGGGSGSVREIRPILCIELVDSILIYRTAHRRCEIFYHFLYVLEKICNGHIGLKIG